MPQSKIDRLIESAEAAFLEAVAYFNGPESTSDVRVGEWGPKEVLCHLLYWHEVTSGGMESVAASAGPHRVKAHVDEVNALAVAARSGRSIPELVQEATGLQQRLIRAARALPDPDAVVLVRSEGTSLSGTQRLEIIAEHWREHIEELTAAH